MQGKKESEVHEFHTKMARCAGPNFTLDPKDLAIQVEDMEEKDRVEIIELDAATFKYA